MTLTPYRFARELGIGLWQVTVWGPPYLDRARQPVPIFLLHRPQGWSLRCPGLGSTVTTGGLNERRLDVCRLTVAEWRRQLADPHDDRGTGWSVYERMT